MPTTSLLITCAYLLSVMTDRRVVGARTDDVDAVAETLRLDIVTCMSNILLMQVTNRELSPTAAARREQIVAAAIEVIAAKGYGQASFGRIAEHAGLSSTRLISYHFKGKSELIQAVVDRAMSDAAAFMRPRMDAATTRRDTLASYIESNLEFMRDHPAHIRALVEIIAGTRGGGDTSVSDTSSMVAEEFFRAGQAEGAFRAFDPHVMAVSLRAAIDAVAIMPDVDHTAYARELVALFDHATRKDQS
jgi:AcrR family transcriptional regulator